MRKRSSIEAFLAGQRIALVGLSTRKEHFSRAVFGALRAHGYEVIPIHPTAAEIEGVPAYPSLKAAPMRVDGVLVMTRADHSAQVVREAIEAGATRIWLHRGMGSGAVSPEAVAIAHQHGVDVIEGECPMMFLDQKGAHRVHAVARKLTGKYPEPGERQRPSYLSAAVFLIACAVTGWALSAVSLVFLLWVLPETAAIFSRAMLAPIFYGLVAAIHHLRHRELPPLLAAAGFTLLALLLDGLITSPLFLGAGGLFASSFGAWVPLLLIFVTTAAVGVAVRDKKDVKSHWAHV